jgi:hypothetical protein
MERSAAIVGVDIGTTATKAVVYAPDGRVLAHETREYPLRSPLRDWAEQDPDELFEAVLDSLSGAARKATEGGAKISGVAFSAAMHTLIALDGGGRPITPCVTFADNRAVKQAARIKETEGPAIHRRTGTPIHPMSPLANSRDSERRSPRPSSARPAGSRSRSTSCPACSASLWWTTQLPPRRASSTWIASTGAREPAYLYLLRKEFEERGCRLRALNDRGDDSPEGELTDGILDQLAKFERAKLAERSRRGKMRKAREGHVGVTTPKYGFRYNEARDGLVVHEPEMKVVEKVFRMAVEGLGVMAMRTRLRSEGIPSPKGGELWHPRMLRLMVASDIYRPHDREELAGLLAPEVAARLDPDKRYGICWFNRQKTSVHTVSEPDGNGGRRYRSARQPRSGLRRSG